ncbi:MAG: DUF523 domain-containing protein [Candidatus Marinimicrobia bacterium]|nr:DUF523 domain-containing protein [Candidatus Neomarinimicrobiota bacterium]
MGKKVLISACLLGKNCRYNGGHSQITELNEIDVEWIPVCPEETGGLGTPRPSAEMQDNAENILNGKGKVVNNKGINVTSEFIRGAEKSLQSGLETGLKTAILKSKSPSCGIGKIYDGSFTNTLKTGDGIFAHLCQINEITCISSDNINQIKKTLAKVK